MATGKLEANWQLANCGNPTGLAFDENHGQLFSVCDNQKMVVTSSTTGKQVAIVNIGLGPDGAAFDENYKNELYFEWQRWDTYDDRSGRC